MSAVAAKDFPREAFELREAVQVAPPEALHRNDLIDLLEAAGVDDAADLVDTTIPIYILRPCVGRGKGRHLYEAAMLERDAGVFKDWKMYVDHEAPEAQKRKGGLPRSIRDLGGIIKESFWHPGIPADPENGFGQGAVIGLTKPVPLIRELIDTDPNLVESSIRANATGVHPVQRGREQVWCVEGIQPKGSVDWVTEAGAGGRIAALMEATLDETLVEAAALKADLLSELGDAEFAETLRRERPDLYGALQDDREGEDMTITPEALQEALESDDGKAVLSGMLKEAFDAYAEEHLPKLVEEALGEERGLAEAEARAHADHTLWLRDARDRAHEQIAEARLPEAFMDDLRSRYDIVDGQPTPALDVIDEVDGEGAVVKRADDILAESVKGDIDQARKLYASARPARASVPVLESADGEKPEGEQKEKRPTTGSRLTDELLMEAAVPADELDDVYAGVFDRQS